MLELWRGLCMEFTPEALSRVLRRTAQNFRQAQYSLESLVVDDEFDDAVQLGVIEFPNAESLMVVAVRVEGELTARSSKKRQYDLAKAMLKHSNHNAAIFAFYDATGRFRLSLVVATYHGTRRTFTTFRRYTFFVDPVLPNKTFLQQMRTVRFSSLTDVLAAFSIEAVSDQFYGEFKDRYDDLWSAVRGTKEPSLKQDFALLFAIRIIFLGFVQKKNWLGNNTMFIQDYWDEYKGLTQKNSFYRHWLEPLFFEALSAPPGHKRGLEHVPFSEQTRRALEYAPYLNGELFKRKQGVDDCGLWIPDESIGRFFDFLFQYNFTVEENELYDEELELNPEFLGIIFERITNKDQGAVYTPREEVDLMCRLALVKWLEKTTGIDKRDLYHLFFREGGTGEVYDEHQKQGDFSPHEIRTLIDRLENVTICDPAAGSGAFEVGMLQVLEQVLENLYCRSNTPDEVKRRAPSPFERKKAIIARSLYGVEVKSWAVWINHLRLWLTLFVDMPDEFRESADPLLPNLTFKVRTGDSLVQRIGSKTFPVKGDIRLPQNIKKRITELKQKKIQFFYNRRTDDRAIEGEKLDLFRAILDHEIAERKQRIHELSQPTYKAQNLFGTEYEQEGFGSAEEEKERKIEWLNAEIDELKAQKRGLEDNPPFIWSIEFPEVFFDSGGFDIIIGNPPYLRQEEIIDPLGRLEPKLYKDALMEMLRLDFPDHFAKDPLVSKEFRKGRKPSGRSDLYTYFYARSLRLLNRNGVHVFICSNSWLDVAYGAWLQEFFLRQSPLYFVIDNHARRSFARADINTVITVAGAPSVMDESHIVRFVAFKRPFEEVMLSENLLRAEYAVAIDNHEDFRILPIAVGELLRVGSKRPENQEATKQSGNSIPGLSPTDMAVADSPSSTYSTRPVNSLSMSFGEYLGDKWGGKYLRAPDVFFTILEKGKNVFAPLGEIAEVRFGLKTGANDFFYLEPLGIGSRHGLVRVRNNAGWEGEIEEEFLKPVIKSPRECSTTLVHPDSLKYTVFMCNRSKAALRGTRALEYIKWGEEKGYNSRSTLRARRRWWDLGRREPGVYLWPMIHNDRLAAFVNTHAVQVDHNLFEITPKDKEKSIVSLFSVFSVLVRELFGRSNLGEGALKTEGVDIKQFPSLAIDTVDVAPLLNREIQSIFVECGIIPESNIPIAMQEPNPLPDRKALDDIVFDVLGLTEEERQDVYRAVCQLVWDRISRARSV